MGTDEKREYLMHEFGIPENRIFTSRSPTFASDLLKATDGRGVDIVLNSLTGEMLDASWRCIAYGGTFLEIGKKDMVDRKTLSMEPFNRNACYRPVDMSHEDVPHSLINR